MPSDDVKPLEVTPSDYVKLPEVTPGDVGPSLLEKMIKVMTELMVVDLIRRFELAFALSLLSYVVYTWMWPPLRPYVEPYWEGIKKNEVFLKVVEKLRLGDVLVSTKGRIKALEKKMLELEARVEKLEAEKEKHEK